MTTIAAAFTVDKVRRESAPTLPTLAPEVPFVETLGIKAERIEAVRHTAEPVDFTKYRAKHGSTTRRIHGLLAALHTAYADHLGLVLRPDDIWLAIVQGFAQHALLHPDDVRAHVTDSSEKKTVLVSFPFQKGNKNAPWDKAIGDFADTLATHIGPKKVQLLSGDFSTTGPVERLCQRAAMMEALSPFYQYRGFTLCGIPTITLLGDASDWYQLHQRARALGDLGAPAPWVAKLDRFTLAFAEAATGPCDTTFFRNLYKLEDHSGGPYVEGEINALFPYVRNYKTGAYDLPNGGNHNHLGNFVSGMSRVPITWDYLGQSFDMALYAGFTGVTFTDQGVAPTLGWAITDETAPPTPKEPRY